MKEFSLDSKRQELFDAKINRAGPDECWEWLAAKDSCGYGSFGVGTHIERAHRIAYAIYVGPVGDLCVLHKCDNPGCVNPKHLFLGTRIDNNRDRTVKGRTGFRATYGAEHGTTKLTLNTVQRIRSLAGSMSQSKIAAFVGTSRANVGNILRRETWQYV